MMRNTWSSVDISYYFIHVNFFATRARVGPGPDQARTFWTGPGPSVAGLALKGQGQGRPGLACGQSRIEKLNGVGSMYISYCQCCD